MNKAGVITSSEPLPSIEEDGGILNEAKHEDVTAEFDEVTQEHEDAVSTDPASEDESTPVL